MKEQVLLLMGLTVIYEFMLAATTAVGKAGMCIPERTGPKCPVFLMDVSSGNC